MHRRGDRRGRATPALLVGALLLATPLSAQDDPVLEPLEIGLEERTGTALMFIDVEALDKQGRPIPGLVKDDFQIRVNYLPRSIFSVDDLCPCLVPPDPAEQPASVARLATIDPGAPALLRELNRPVYVLYFDTSQLQRDGREIALAEAQRWIDEVRRPDDEAMIVAFSREGGVRRLSGLTGDSERLLGAIRQVQQDPGLTDEFPSRLSKRMALCREGAVSCYHSARQDYMQSRASYRSLLNFVTELDEIPRRKILFFFHQNNAIFPGRLYAAGNFAAAQLADGPDDTTGIGRQLSQAYGTVTAPGRLSNLMHYGTGQVMLDGASSDLVPDLVRIVDAIGGTATASRTSIYPVVSGASQTWAVNLGANLADYTGGHYNRGGEDLPSMLDDAGRGCGCFYRIGLKVEERSKSKVFRTKVKVRGRPLRSRYRVQYVTDADRWMRKAQSVLESPSEFSDVALQVEIVPFRGGGKKWDLRVQVAVDLESLKLDLEREDNHGEWEIGALLADSHGKKSWEMLAVSRLRRNPDELEPEEEEGVAVVVHERTFTGLKAGSYQLRAFVRDRTTKLYGGAETDIQLPAVDQPMLVGPLSMRAPVRHLVASLPIRNSKKDRAQSRSAILEKSLPHDAGSSESGVPLEFTTLICPAVVREARTQVQRRLLRDGVPAAEFGRPGTRRAGECVALSDVLETDGLAEGLYTYRVRWDRGSAGPPVDSETTFRIVAGSDDP